MWGSWTFGRKIAAGFAVVLAFTIVVGAVAIYALRGVVADKDRVITVNAENRLDAEKMRANLETKVAVARGYLLTSDGGRLADMREARAQFHAILARLRSRIADGEARRLLESVERAEGEHQAAMDATIEQRRALPHVDAVAERFETEVMPKREVLSREIEAFTTHEAHLLGEARQAASDAAASAMASVAIIVAAVALLAFGVTVFLARTLSRQIGSAVQHVQSSSAELQSAATQQVAGSKEQATAMNEITTTINELLATSKQIADSAQRVAAIADDTARSARTGEHTVSLTSESIAAIKRQVDLIVTHMLDLGKKSQQIGGILEIINELSEQTNILAINATIEAAGVGEAGKRFSAVADEIRKLADRVGGSTKEIRGLIDEIRAAVNATVMTTEGGTKAVDAGARQFAEVAAALQQIVSSVGTTTEAAREIELSTKQQSTAVEQVNVAISNVAQATRETETSAGQTLQTASQLTGLSRNLMRLVRANGGG
jgi:methyl-accepting chemotaxis protein